MQRSGNVVVHKVLVSLTIKNMKRSDMMARSVFETYLLLSLGAIFESSRYIQGIKLRRLIFDNFMI